MHNTFRLYFRTRNVSTAKSSCYFKSLQTCAAETASRQREHIPEEIDSSLREEPKIETLKRLNPLSSSVASGMPVMNGEANTAQNIPLTRIANDTAVKNDPTESTQPLILVPPLGSKFLQNTLASVRNEYPAAPSYLFDEMTIQTAIQNILKGYGLDVRESVSKIGRKRAFQCVLAAPLPSGVEEAALGRAARVRDATRAAYVQLLVKLHNSGVLKDLFSTDSDNFDKKTLAKEKDAKIDVYNYAASHGHVPQITTRKLPLQGLARVEVSLKVEPLGIEVVARGSSLCDAEIAASIKFKREAQNLHTKLIMENDSSNDMSVLTLDSMKSFINFYTGIHPGIHVDVRITHEEDKSSGNRIWQAQALINGRALGKPVTFNSKKGAGKLAYLVAAVELSQKESDILQKFSQALRDGAAGILLPVKPVDMNLKWQTIQQIDDTLRHVSELGLPNEEANRPREETPEGTRQIRERPELHPYNIIKKNQLLKRKAELFRDDPDLATLRDAKENLPMSQYREHILEHVNQNPYSVIVGATGSGKTTQVPQIILDDAIARGAGATCNIICTQPRRIAATSVARRVAEERNERLQDTVGYQIRFDTRLPQPGGSITYCTTGVLLQQLQRAPDTILDDLSHIIVDEVHERDILIDFLMLIIKQSVEARRATGKSVPQVVLMSATIDPKLFAEYFQVDTLHHTSKTCPSLIIPGRTFPVAEKYFETIDQELQNAHGSELSKVLQLDDDTVEYMKNERVFRCEQVSTKSGQTGTAATAIDWKHLGNISADETIAKEKEDAVVPVSLVAATIAHIAKTTSEGAVLAFLPGYDEIKRVKEILLQNSPLDVNFSDESRFHLFMLHSSVSSVDQASVLKPTPRGCRKIILSTNIAETSVTIPDIQYIVDTGKLREKRYDQFRRITKLQCIWVSKSNAKQRAGRAGRVQNGSYYALYSKDRAQTFRAMGLPEMLRSDLQEVCLDVKAQAFQMPIRDFLAEAIEPPPEAAVDASIENLETLGAFTPDEKLTVLGRLLANLPVHPSLGKMIVLGVIFRCLDPMVILGAALNERSLFTMPLEKRKDALAARQCFLQGTESDHLALVNAIRTLRHLEASSGEVKARRYCETSFLHYGAFKTIENTSSQIEAVLVEAGLIPFLDAQDRVEGQIGHPSLNKNATSVSLIKALVLSGLHPNLAVPHGNFFRTPGEDNALIHPSSLNHIRPLKTKTSPEAGWQAFKGPLLTYSTMHKANDGNQIFLRDTTVCTPLMAALFGGDCKVGDEEIIKMDDWLPFSLRGIDGSVSSVMELRKIKDLLLAAAFQSLSDMRSMARSGHYSQPIDALHSTNTENKFLADDETREAFTAGLVDILDQDAKNNKKAYGIEDFF